MRLRQSTRRGVAALVILAVISMTFAVTYMMLRTQGMAQQVQQNTSRADLSRQAAMAGLSIAINRMQQSSWSGPGTALSGPLSSYESYSVTFATGDDRLTTSSTDYAMWPYRVTISVTGTSIDPANSANVSTSKLKAVVQLVPRALGSTPSSWDTVMQYTVYQSSNGSFSLNWPARMEGNIRVQGGISLADELNMSSTHQQRYLSDLRSMKSNGVADYRPFTGTITLPTWNTSSSTRSLLSSNLGITLTNASETSLGWSAQYGFDNYQLYPGGDTYSIPRISGTIRSRTLAADPKTNPLGIFYASDTLVIAENVTVTGTIIAAGDVYFYGRNSSISPLSLPALRDTTANVQLPALICNDDVYVWDDTSITLNGSVIAWDKFNVLNGGSDVGMSIVGSLVARNIDIDGRWDWVYTSGGSWNSYYGSFTGQLNSKNGTSYFPEWLRIYRSLYSNPNIVIKPPPNLPKYHFPTRNGPLYLVNSSDTGLRWDMLSTAWVQ